MPISAEIAEPPTPLACASRENSCFQVSKPAPELPQVAAWAWGNAALFASIEQRYGVPAGPLIAIWGMESAFGSQRGNQNMLSSIATLAYDCRRPEYFTDQLYAALKLVDRGTLSASQRGSMHGEIGQTQFLPKNIAAYGVGNLETPSGALNSTANFLKAHGWRAGAGYQPGEPNFAAIEEWNAAQVYQKAIALMGRQIDGGE